MKQLDSLLSRGRALARRVKPARRAPREGAARRSRWIVRRDGLLLLLVAIGASFEAPRLASGSLRPAQELASIPETVAEVPARLAAATDDESHLGFDTNKYPGDDAMRAWKHDDSPYEWVGYYLPAPCHKDESWSGKRQTLQDMGWGLAVVYVGQQTWGRTPGQPVVRTSYVSKRVKTTRRVHGKRVTRYVTRRVPVRRTVPASVAPGSTCDADLVSGSRGRSEADDAIARTAAEGFARGTVIFLDVEYMPFVPAAMRDYYRSWVARVLQDGRYRPGIYVNKSNASTVYGDVKAVFQAAGVKGEPPFWVAGGKGFSPDKTPSDVGHLFASVWQGKLDIKETRNGVRLPIDVNVAAVPSPSSHVYDYAAAYGD